MIKSIFFIFVCSLFCFCASSTSTSVEKTTDASETIETPVEETPIVNKAKEAATPPAIEESTASTDTEVTTSTNHTTDHNHGHNHSHTADPNVPSSNETKIFWESSQKLNWTDFQARNPSNAGVHAYSMVGISFAVLFNTETAVEVGVYGYFQKESSWVQSGQQTSHLLNHEQLHFDICEIYRRILKKRIMEYPDFTYANFGNKLNELFHKTFDEFNKEQELYDRITNHSIKKELQKEWNARIAKKLKELNKFAGDFATASIRKN